MPNKPHVYSSRPGKMSAETLAQLIKDNPKGISKAMASWLVAFGYPSVTPEWVEGEIKRLQAPNAKFQGGPSMFIDGWLKEGIDES